MDIRNVQRTGSMFYVYLPTSWCKKYNIDGDSKVQLTLSPDGSLVVSPQFQKPEPKRIELDVDESDIEVLNKVIVASYLNPATSFRINLQEELDYTELLEQKKLVSIELIEVEGKTIRCESSITASDPHSLLKTMISKIKNMIIVMQKSDNKELVDRYEEEIDRNRLMIDKTIISSFTYEQAMASKPIELYYISQIARDLERMADHIGLLEGRDEKFLQEIKEAIDEVQDILEGLVGKEEFETQQVIDLIKRASMKRSVQFKDMQDYYRKSVKQYIENISEILMDWAVTRRLE